MRRKIADELAVPAFVVFADTTLQELARVRPSSPATLLNVRGVGQRKVEQFGERILEHIRTQCAGLALAMDNGAGSRPRSAPASGRTPGSLQAAELFDRGLTIAEVARRMSRAESTVRGYLSEYIASAAPSSISPWVEPATYLRVETALHQLGDVPSKALFEHLGGEVSYDSIRFVRQHLKGSQRPTAAMSDPAPAPGAAG
jgi:ATP-dependent DNA helicase RecQ